MSSRSVPRSLVGPSIDLIQGNQAPTGAYVAAPGYANYAYCWLRDGAFIAVAMDAHGHHASAVSFHRWAVRTIEHHSHKVEHLEAEATEALRGDGSPLRLPDDSFVLHTRFTIDGREGQSLWGNFQLDGYGFWLTSITRHCTTTGADPAFYWKAIDLVSRYLMLTWERPCFDAWEEYPTRRHTATWAAVAKGLHDSGNLVGSEAAIAVSQEITGRLIDHTNSDGALLKFVPDSDGEMHPIAAGASQLEGLAIAGHERVGRPLSADTIDGSALLVLGPFGPFPPTHRLVSDTLQAIEDELVVDGGVHRYAKDEYYGGGLWIVLAGALASAHAPHKPQRANEILDWIESQADADGNLSEQTSSHLREPESLEPWLQRWGPPAKPLLWSHAMYLHGVAALGTEVSPSTDAPQPETLRP